MVFVAVFKKELSFIKLRKFYSVANLLSFSFSNFKNEWVLNFIKWLYYIYWRDHVIFFLLYSVNWGIIISCIDYFSNSQQTLLSWNKLKLIVLYYSFYISLDSIGNNLFRILHLHSWERLIWNFSCCNVIIRFWYQDYAGLII